MSVSILAIVGLVELLLFACGFVRPNLFGIEKPFITKEALAPGAFLGEILRCPLRREDIPPMVVRKCGLPPL